jgi:hypothetical protein
MTHTEKSQTRFWLTFVLFSLVSFSILSCAEYDKGVGRNLVGGDEAGEIKELFFPVDDYTSYESGDVLKFSSTQLHLGEQDGFHSDIVLWFANYGALGEVLQMDSVKLKLFSAGYVDPESIDPADEWRAELLQFDELFNPIYSDYEDAQTFPMTPIDTLLLGTVDGDLDTFEVNEFTLELDTLTLDTLLLYLRPLDQPTFIKRFVPWSSVSDPLYLPQIQASGTFIVNEDTLVDTTLIVNPLYTTWYTDDAGLPADAGRLPFGQGYARDVLFSSDFTGLDPSTQSLNRVDLVVTADGEWEKNMGSPTAVTWWDIQAEWLADPDTVEYGSLSELAYFIPDTTGSIRINVTPIARQWVALPETNFGVAIKSVVAGAAVSRRAIFSGDASVDSTNRPYFHVVYTEFKKP